ncbi:hypothetical protein ABW21_db0204621 [Orbilia brochopaga]|nr:hypothetical protein ABW21_db0204621 [Drechslerella brochopaga]
MQSWRERWVKSLSKDPLYTDGPKPPPGFDITTVAGWHEGIKRPGEQTSSPSADSAAGQRSSPVRPKTIKVSNSPPQTPAIANPNDQQELVDIINLLDKETVKGLIEKMPDTFSNTSRSLLYGRVQNSEDRNIKAAIRGLFTEEETRALISQANAITFSDTKEEQIEICQTIADEIKPVMKQIIKKGKVEGKAMEEAVLRHLQSDVKIEALQQQQQQLRQLQTSDSVALQRGASPPVPIAKPDTRFEDLSFSGAAPRPSLSTAPAASGQADDTKTRSSKSPGNSKSPVMRTPMKGQVLVYTPQNSKREPYTPNIANPPHTPVTVKPTQRTPLDKVAVRTDPPSQQNSPTPRQKVSEVIDLTSDAEEEPPSSAAKTQASFEFDILVEDRDSPEEPTYEAVPPSSPPRLVGSEASRFSVQEQLLSIPRRLAPLGTNILSFSSVYEESSDIPYREATKVIPSSARKSARHSSSRPSSKRRKVEGRSYSDMIVQNTPESKLLPIQDTSSAQSNQPDNSFNQRAPSPTLSPLAGMSRKRKASLPVSARQSARSSPQEDFVVEDTEPEEAGPSGSVDEEEEDEDEDETVNMHIGGVLNRNLGFLNDNSPGLQSRQESDAGGSNLDDDLDEILDKHPGESFEDSQVWTNLFMPWIASKAKRYGVGYQDVALILDRTCCGRKLTVLVLDALQKHLYEGGSYEG